MYALIISIIIIVAFLLILVVLAQNPKGGGLSSQFGGSGTQQIMGVKKTGDILEKMTWGLAIALMILTLSTTFFITDDRSQEFTSPNIDNAQESVVPSQGIQSSPQGNDPAIEDLGLEDTVN